MGHNQWLPRPIDATKKQCSLYAVPSQQGAITQSIQNENLQHMNLCIVLNNSLQNMCAVNFHSHSKRSYVNSQIKSDLKRPYMTVQCAVLAWVMLLCVGFMFVKTEEKTVTPSVNFQL